MDHVLTEYGLRLTYLRDRYAIDDLDQDRILADLAEDRLNGDPDAWFTRYPLTDLDHLVLVTDRFSGRYLGFLGAQDGATNREEYLLLKSAFVAASARGQNLMRRMLALAILRIGSFGSVPAIIAAYTHSPICYHILQGTARRFTGSAFFPEPGNVAIDFKTTTLAKRIAQEISPRFRVQATTGTIRGVMPLFAPRELPSLSTDPHIDSLFGRQAPTAAPVLALLDLRAADEMSIFDDARKLYRAR